MFLANLFSPPQSFNYLGKFTLATLPSAAGNQAAYAFATDLGGGPDMVISDGANWKHIRRGMASAIAPVSAYTITPLASPTIISITGSLTIAMTLNLSLSNLYPGYEFTVSRPGVLGLGGSLGLSLGGGSALFSQLGSSWADYQYDGSTLKMLRGSSLI